MFLKLEEMIVGKVAGKGSRKLNRRTCKISQRKQGKSFMKEEVFRFKALTV